MKRRRILGTRALASLLVGASLLTVAIALLFSQRPSASEGTRSTTILVRPPNRPSLGKYLGRLSVREPKEYEGLSIFPLTTRSTFPLDEYLTLDEALNRDLLRVTELDEGGQVNTLQLENVSDKYIFAMSGEIMKGAKQDRTLQNDLLIPPRSGKMKVSVYCTEHGRWVAQTKSFEGAGASVPNSVRSAAKVEKQQSSVWDSISANQSRLKVAAPTRAAKEVYAAPQVQREIKPYVDRLSGVPILDSRTVGVAAAYGNRIIAVDVFGDTSLFRELYPKLLRSYVVDVVGDPWRGSTSVKDIEEILANATDAIWTTARTDGVGMALEFHQAGLHGSALLYKDMILHSDLFVSEVKALERGGLNPRGQINSPPPNLRIRREQHLR